MLLGNDKTDIGIKKTSAQWQSLYPRKNYDYSWNEELITLEEYKNRCNRSTCLHHCNFQ